MSPRAAPLKNHGKKVARASEKLLMKPVRLRPIGTNRCVHARQNRSSLPFIPRFVPPTPPARLIPAWKFENRYLHTLIASALSAIDAAIRVWHCPPREIARDASKRGALGVERTFQRVFVIKKGQRWDLREQLEKLGTSERISLGWEGFTCFRGSWLGVRGASACGVAKLLALGKKVIRVLCYAVGYRVLRSC